MELLNDLLRNESRRQFLGRGANAVGWAAMASLLGNSAAQTVLGADGTGGKTPDLKQLTHFAPKAKRVIYLHMVGA